MLAPTLPPSLPTLPAGCHATRRTQLGSRHPRLCVSTMMQNSSSGTSTPPNMPIPATNTRKKPSHALQRCQTALLASTAHPWVLIAFVSGSCCACLHHTAATVLTRPGSRHCAPLPHLLHLSQQAPLPAVLGWRQLSSGLLSSALHGHVSHLGRPTPHLSTCTRASPGDALQLSQAAPLASSALPLALLAGVSARQSAWPVSTTLLPSLLSWPGSHSIQHLRNLPLGCASSRVSVSGSTALQAMQARSQALSSCA